MNQFQHVPQELKSLNQWVVHKNKQPYDMKTGYGAKARTPETWGSFGQAIDALQSGKYDGIGFEFHDNGIVGIDIDHCIDTDTGEISQLALHIYDTLNSYTEYSPSSTGLHIYVYGDVPDEGRKSVKNGIEVYKAGRYFTVTGNVFGEPKPIQNRQAEILTIFNELFPQDSERTTAPPTYTPRDKDYLKIGLEKDEKFKRLWHGERNMGDESSDDMALMNKLAYWCNNDTDMMMQAFLSSPYVAQKDEPHQKKLKRKDYLLRTAQKAVKENNGTAASRDSDFRYKKAVQEFSQPITQDSEHDPPIQEMDLSALTKEDLISADLFDYLLSIQDDFERTQAETQCLDKAREFKAVKAFEKNFKQYKIKKTQEKMQEYGTDTRGKTNFKNQPIQLNCGDWTADWRGVFKNDINMQTGEMFKKIASPIPILPTEVLENIDSGIEKIRLSYLKNGWKSIICERSTTASNTKIISLADKGIEVNSENAKLLVAYIADLVALNLKELPRYNAVGRLGWVNNMFMPYDTIIKFDGEEQNRYLYNSVTNAGDFQKWKDFITPLRKNIYLRLIMAASFASPIIERTKTSPFVFHLWGRTGKGKTVGLMVAMSIWGNPCPGKLVRTMNMTTNSMLSTAAFLNNIPFAGDELQTIKSHWDNYDKLIMVLTEGIERGRMSYDKNNETKSWKCSFLFTGEESCTKESSAGGAKNRVIEIETEHEVINDGNAVVNFVSENYGHAGKVFIDAIRNEDLTEQYRFVFKKIMETHDTTEKQAMAMSLILLGDYYAVKCLFPDEPPLKVMDIGDFLTSTKDIDTSERAYEFVLSLVAINKNRFNETSNTGEIWGEIRSVDGYVLINKDILIREMRAKGYEFEAEKKDWANKGYLIRNTQGKFYSQTWVGGERMNYIKIKLPPRDDFVPVNPDEQLPFT